MPGHHNNVVRVASVEYVEPKKGAEKEVVVIGDIAGSDCIIVDDIVDTGEWKCVHMHVVWGPSLPPILFFFSYGFCLFYCIYAGNRMMQAAEALKKQGARRVFGYATHGVFTGNSIANISESCLKELVVFNTIPYPHDKFTSKIRILNCGGLLAEAIRKLHNKEDLCD